MAKDDSQDTNVEVRVPCEVYSRIVGYLTPVQNWNEGKQQEFNERAVFNVNKADSRSTESGQSPERGNDPC